MDPSDRALLLAALLVGSIVAVRVTVELRDWLATPEGHELRLKMAALADRIKHCEGCARRRALLAQAAEAVLHEAGGIIGTEGGTGE